MANRNMLHISKLQDFEQWLSENGWTIEKPNGVYEVLRARKITRKNPLIVFKKANAKEHLSVMDRDIDVIRAYIRK